MSLTLEQLDLDGVALTAATELKAAHPEVVFTSGRRTRAQQAHAMATNVLLNRRWIVDTYLFSAASGACQAWLDAYPQAVSLDEVAAGLEDVLDSFSDDELAHLSKHLAGHAFDVQPNPALRTALAALAAKYNGKFLDHEGGLPRYHLQF